MGQISENTKAFLELVKAHPDLPIIPIVSEDLVPECNVGEFGFSEATSYVKVKQDDGIWYYTKEEQEELEDRIAEDLLDDDEGLTVEQASVAAHEKAEALDWTPAIIVYINRADPEEDKA